MCVCVCVCVYVCVSVCVYVCFRGCRVCTRGLMHAWMTSIFPGKSNDTALCKYSYNSSRYTLLHSRVLHSGILHGKVLLNVLNSHCNLEVFLQNAFGGLSLWVLNRMRAMGPDSSWTTSQSQLTPQLHPKKNANWITPSFARQQQMCLRSWCSRVVMSKSAGYAGQ